MAKRAKAAAAVLLIAVALLMLSHSYAIRFHNLGTAWDLWFGADIPRVIYWAGNLTYVERGHLHPLMVALLKLYHAALYLLGSHPTTREVPIFALPMIAGIAGGTTLSAHVVGRSLGSASAYLCLAALLLIGPLAIFGPVPESHALGGVALLVQGAYLLAWLHAPPDASRERRRYAIASLAAGTVATGLTLINGMPAVILAIPILRSMSARRSAGLIAMVVGVIVALVAFTLLLGGVRAPGGLDELVRTELNWLHAPSAGALYASASGLIALQFGAPHAELVRWHNDLSNTWVTSIDSAGVGAVQVIALLCCVAALAMWWRDGRRNATNELVIVLCLAALASVVAFHTMYATPESYLFSAHAWPFVVLPLLVVGVSGWQEGRRRIPIVIAVAALLSGAQTVLAIVFLHRLPGQPG